MSARYYTTIITDCRKVCLEGILTIEVGLLVQGGILSLRRGPSNNGYVHAHECRYRILLLPITEGKELVKSIFERLMPLNDRRHDYELPEDLRSVACTSVTGR